MKKILYLFIMMISSIASANDYILSSIDETLKLSQNSGKPALVIFGSEDCKFCDILKNEILDKNYIDNYIVCYIDISNEKNKSLKDTYKIHMIPDSRIFINKTETSRLKGFEKNKYIDWLKKHD
jgi:thioredoxin-related protein